MIVTESGRLQGVVGAEMLEYLGIPYAAAPLGALRWMPPQSFGKWTGILQATQTGSQCPQLDSTGETTIGNENCLFVNVYTPVGDDGGSQADGR